MYIVDFDIVALILSGLSLVLYYLQKRIITIQSQRFGLTLWAVFFSNLFGILSSFAINSLPTVNKNIVLVLTTLYYLFHNSIPLLLVLFILSISADHKKTTRFRRLFLFPWISAMGLILINPFSGIVFYIDSQDHYHHGPTFFMLYAFLFIYLLLIFLLILSHKTKLSRPNRYALITTIVLFVTAILIQNRFKGLMLEDFMISLSMLLVLLSVQNADEFKDGLSGLYNRDAFILFLQQCFDEKKPFSVLALSASELGSLQYLVDMKTYGQAVRVFSSWLSETVGKTGNACILESGLYALVIESPYQSGLAGELALDMVSRSRESWNFDPLRIEIPVRIGILNCPLDARDVPSVFDHIDQMKDLSIQGGNRHIFYSGDFIPDKRRREASIALYLRKLNEATEPELLFQPIYSVEQGRVVALETLFTLTLEGGIQITQSECLRIAEQLGVAQKLSELIFDRAFEWYVRNNLEQKGIEQLQMRLLSSQSVEMDWPRSLISIAEGRSMDLSRLCLEITETAVVNTGEELRLNMGLLKGLGVTFALDDYGSGYTDLGRILTLPFSIIKIDKKIIKLSLETQKGRRLLEGSIGLFKLLDRRIIAEGIENPENAEIMTLMGCDALQGFYYGKPMTKEELLAISEGEENL